MLTVLFIRTAKYIHPSLGPWVDRVFEFYPAVNIEHKVERTNAFVTLVFGYSVVAVIYQSTASFGLNAFFGKAVLGLIQAFCFNWIYFELDGADLFAHAIRRNVTAGKCSFLLRTPLSSIPLESRSECLKEQGFPVSVSSEYFAQDIREVQAVPRKPLSLIPPSKSPFRKP